MRTTLERKTILAAFFMALLGCAIIGVVILPTILDIQELSQQTEVASSFLERRALNAQNLHISLEQSNKIKQDTNTYDKYFFRKGSELSLITSLEDVANKNAVNAKIESSNLDKIAAGKYVVLSISANGQYANILQYLADLEQLDYFININNVSLISAMDKSAGKATKIINASFKISLYANN